MIKIVIVNNKSCSPKEDYFQKNQVGFCDLEN